MFVLHAVSVHRYTKQKECSHDEYEKHCVENNISFTCKNCALVLMKEVREQDGKEMVMVAIPEFLRNWSGPVITKHSNEDHKQHYRYTKRRNNIARRQ